MKGIRAKSWSPYAVGVGIGILSWFAFATANHGLGVSTPFENTAAIAEGAISASAIAAWSAAHTPKIDWEWMLVLGVFLGSVVSSKLSGDRKHDVVPPMWRARFGGSVPVRLAAAFAGGLLMMLGARLARGCTSGHGITGTMQLAVSSWIFISLAFAVATIAALALFGRPRVSGGE